MPDPFDPILYADGVPHSVECGIYRFEIEDIGTYIGKFSSPDRPASHYSRNVNRWLDELPYRANKTDGWRVVHRALRLALKHEKGIKLTIVEACPPPISKEWNTYLNDRERDWKRREGTLNDAKGRVTLAAAYARLGDVNPFA